MDSAYKLGFDSHNIQRIFLSSWADVGRIEVDTMIATENNVDRNSGHVICLKQSKCLGAKNVWVAFFVFLLSWIFGLFVEPANGAIKNS